MASRTAASRSRRESDAAAAPVLGVLIAAAIIISTLAAVVSIVADGSQRSAQDNVDLDLKARDMLHLMVSEPGRTSTGLMQWDDSPDALERFGLSSSKGRNFLDGDKLHIMRRGLKTLDDSNGYPDYPEVRNALGLTGYDFHIRSFPLLYSVDDERFNKFRGMSAAYIGEFEATSTPTPDISVNVTGTDAGDHVVVSFEFTCAASLASSFPDVLLLTTKFKTGTGNGFGTIQMNHRSDVINCYVPSDSVTIPVRYEKMDWKATQEMRYDVTSVYAGRKLVDNAQVDFTFASGSEAFTLSAEAEETNFWSTGAGASDPVLILDKKTRGGVRHESAVVVDVTVTAPGGAAVTYEDIRIPPTDEHRLTLTGLTSTISLDGFVAAVASANGTAVAAAEERFTFTDTEQALPSTSPTAAAQIEIDLLDGLVQNFVDSPYRNDAGSTGLGDVFRDTNLDLRQTLADAPHGDRILWLGRDGVADSGDEYDIAVVGSGVKSAFMSGDMASSLRDWVENEGGTLLVLGVDSNNAQWLQNEFEIHLVTASGGISAPDPTHPSLTSPESLNYRSYDSGGRRYQMSGDVYDGFTHVLVGTMGDDSSEDTLAISNPGVYGDGTVILASFIPESMTSDSKEQLKFMNNMLTQSLGPILLDFGPPIPPGTPVGSATRLVVAPHPHDPTVFMELKIILYVWQ